MHGRIPRRRVLVVNVYFPETREPVRLTREVPNTLAPILLAGAFDEECCEIRIWNEVSSGFLEVYEPGLVEWPDMVVFTGLIASFDRMKQLAAYFRTARPDAILVAGGQAIRAFRHYAKQFFDYVCAGDVEQLREVVREAWGRTFVAEEMRPRYDLADWIQRPFAVGYAESSRNCNFRCDFCTLTAEGGRYQKQPIGAFRMQLAALGKHNFTIFLDNQFFGPDRDFFLERMALLRELRAEGKLGAWSAICTNNFLWDEENIRAAREAGCLTLFIGVESFDTAWLRSVNKTQNTSPKHSQIELIERCIRGGILFQYGIVFDPTERRIADLDRELRLICDTPEIPPPNFIFASIPFPGTPFFHQRLAEGLILPNTKTRDLEGSTLSLQPLDGVEAVASYIRRIKYFHGFRGDLVKHQARFLWHYRKNLTAAQKVLSSSCIVSLFSPSTFSDPRNALVRKRARTHVSTTDRLDDVYTPRLRVDPPYAQWFEPTVVVNRAGELNEELTADVMDVRYHPARAAAQ